jgi:HlyD family secretion protein
MELVKKKIFWVIGLTVLVAVSGLAYFRFARNGAAPAPLYKTVAAAKKHIVGKVTASGTLSATVTVQVGTQISGRVQSLNADFNSVVKKGQVVAKIDPLLFQAAANQASANYLAAKASLVRTKAQAVDADRQLARTKALKEQGLASQQELETSETNVSVMHASIDVASASMAQAGAALSQAQANLSYTTIVSPIDGIVISRNVDVGQTVAASLQAPVLFTIAEDLKKMQVDTNISEGDVGRLAAGMDASFTVDAFPGQRFRGKIFQIRNAAQTVQNVVTYDAVLHVDNADLKLRPGMTANATIVYAERDDALSIPNAALRFRGPVDLSASPSASGSARRVKPGTSSDGVVVDLRRIWVQRAGVLTEARVRLGLSDGTSTEVLDGDVAEGDLVIIDLVGPAGGASASSGSPVLGGGGGGNSPLRRTGL